MFKAPPSYEESTSRFHFWGRLNPAQAWGNSTQNRYALPSEVVCDPGTLRQDVSVVVSYSAAFRGEIIEILVGVLSKCGTVSFLDSSKFVIIISMFGMNLTKITVTIIILIMLSHIDM